MTDAVFKDLVIDAADAQRLAAFWGVTLGLDARPVGASDAALEDGVAEHAIWVNQVPEPQTVKQRVHLDVHVGVDELRSFGATVLTEHPGWTVLRDPEGGELCSFPGSGTGSYRTYELVVDSVDPAAACAWWAERFGLGARHDPADPWHWVEGGGGLPWPMIFNPVPEPKTVKNRIHWDVWGETDAFLAAGATLVAGRQDSPDPRICWDVLADPEGNEFCVFDPDEVFPPEEAAPAGTS